MANDKVYGNRITDNVFGADDGSAIIRKALDHVESKFGWQAGADEALFRGVYYDRAKVGSHIVKVKNNQGERAVLKIQLRPLPFDEGFIIRHISSQSKSKIVKMPAILADEAWNDGLGFGYLIFEDLSDLADLWQDKVTDDKDREVHADFLKEFLNKVLPVEPWFSMGKTDVRNLYKEAFTHFEQIAAQSQHRHADPARLARNKEVYFKIIDQFNFSGMHFTHGHLSGHDVKYDPLHKQYFLLANLYWSYRISYYELTFPMWVDIMHVRDKKLTLNAVLERIADWNRCWRAGLYDHDPTANNQFWFNLLERAATTVMLDLGAGEWLDDEREEKQRLLEVWQELFDWIAKNKLSQFRAR